MLAERKYKGFSMEGQDVHLVKGGQNKSAAMLESTKKPDL